jgi:hypothetical protein
LIKKTKKGLTVLREARFVNSSMDLVIPPTLERDLKNVMDNANIPFVVAINDLQTAIDNQNSNNDEVPNSRAAGTGD